MVETVARILRPYHHGGGRVMIKQDANKTGRPTPMVGTHAGTEVGRGNKE